MDELEDKLGAILNNPQMMQQIMSMAQMMGQMSPPSSPQKEEPPAQNTPSFPSAGDSAMLQRIYGIARQGSVDKNQQALLRALSPYLSKDRIGKLEKAMRAAKIAAVASTALGAGGISFTGR